MMMNAALKNIALARRKLSGEMGDCFVFVAELLPKGEKPNVDKQPLAQAERDKLQRIADRLAERKVAFMRAQAQAATIGNLAAQTGLIGLEKSIKIFITGLGPDHRDLSPADQAKNMHDNAYKLHDSINAVQALVAHDPSAQTILSGLQNILRPELQNLKDLMPRGNKGNRVISLVTYRGENLPKATLAAHLDNKTPALSSRGQHQTPASTPAGIASSAQNHHAVPASSIAAHSVQNSSAHHVVCLVIPSALQASTNIVDHGAQVLKTSPVQVARSETPRIAALQSSDIRSEPINAIRLERAEVVHQPPVSGPAQETIRGATLASLQHNETICKDENLAPVGPIAGKLAPVYAAETTKFLAAGHNQRSLSAGRAPDAYAKLSDAAHMAGFAKTLEAPQRQTGAGNFNAVAQHADNKPVASSNRVSNSSYQQKDAKQQFSQASSADIVEKFKVSAEEHRHPPNCPCCRPNPKIAAPTTSLDAL